MADNFVNTCAKCIHDGGCLAVNSAIDVNGGGPAELIEQLDHAEYADAIAVVPPSVVEDIGFGASGREFRTKAAAEVERLDIDREVDRQPASPGQLKAGRPVIG